MTGCYSQKTIRNTNTCACTHTHTHLLELINKLSKLLEYKSPLPRVHKFILLVCFSINSILLCRCIQNAIISANARRGKTQASLPPRKRFVYPWYFDKEPRSGKGISHFPLLAFSNHPWRPFSCFPSAPRILHSSVLELARKKSVIK